MDELVDRLLKEISKCRSAVFDDTREYLCAGSRFSDSGRPADKRDGPAFQPATEEIVEGVVATRNEFWIERSIVVFRDDLWVDFGSLIADLKPVGAVYLSEATVFGTPIRRS